MGCFVPIKSPPSFMVLTVTLKHFLSHLFWKNMWGLPGGTQLPRETKNTTQTFHQTLLHPFTNATQTFYFYFFFSSFNQFFSFLYYYLKHNIINHTIFHFKILFKHSKRIHEFTCMPLLSILKWDEMTLPKIALFLIKTNQQTPHICCVICRNWLCGVS